MEAPFGLNRKLPYGTTRPDMDFFEATFEGDLPRLKEMATGKDAEERALLADVCFDGLGPLQVAAHMGRLDVVRYLVEDLVFDVNHGSARFGLTALSSAALDGRLDTVRYLLDNRADPNLHDELGEVPLHCAAKYGHDKVTELLLSRGAGVDLTYFHATPLHIAVVYGRKLGGFLVYNFTEVMGWCKIAGTPLVATLYATTEGLEECISLKCVKVLVEIGPYDESSNVKLNVDGDKVVGRKNYPSTSKLYGEAEQYDKSMKDELKLNGDKAVGRKDYLTTSKLYGKAIELDPADATLYSNRSLCLLQIGKATEALSDAKTCIKMRPEWIKGYYREGTALMSLKLDPKGIIPPV